MLHFTSCGWPTGATTCCNSNLFWMTDEDEKQWKRLIYNPWMTTQLYLITIPVQFTVTVDLNQSMQQIQRISIKIQEKKPTEVLVPITQSTKSSHSYSGFFIFSCTNSWLFFTKTSSKSYCQSWKHGYMISLYRLMLEKLHVWPAFKTRGITLIALKRCWNHRLHFLHQDLTNKKKKAIILYLFCQRFEDVDRDNPFRTINSIPQQKPWVSTSSGV
jgi:hypothetical protein